MWGVIDVDYGGAKLSINHPLFRVTFTSVETRFCLEPH